MTQLYENMNNVLKGLGIEGTCVRAEAHRHLAFFDIKLNHKASALKKLERNTKEIALYLKTKTVPLVRLIPEEGIVRLQVALKDAEPVDLMSLYQGEYIPDMILPFLLGEDDGGKKLWMDIVHNPHMLVAGSTGAGKALEINTPIPTPDGWKKIIDLKPGDMVFDQCGNPTKVLATTGAMVGRPCYKMTFSDGSEIIADAQHEWMTLTAKERCANYKYSHREHRKATRKDRSKTASTQRSARSSAASNVLWAKIGRKDQIEHSCRTTEQIRDTLLAQPSSPRPNHSIRITNPLNLPHKDLCIDPYILGIWLGDGTSRTGQITNSDPEIIQELSRNYIISKNNGPYLWCCYGLKAELHALGLLQNKHIPIEYLRASKEQRLALLQGLMDSDGTASAKGACVFTNTNKTLIDGVVELARSLGFDVSVHHKIAKLYGREISDSWNVSINTFEPLFRLTRKINRQNNIKEDKKYGKHILITSVEPVESVPVCCIQTEAQTYLCGERMIPTHNSVLLHNLIANALYIHALRFRNVWIYLADPKRVEFSEYLSPDLNGVIMGVTSTYKEVTDQLEDLYTLMEARYVKMNSIKMRSIEEDPQRFPLVLCIIDEVADLIMQDKKGGKLQDMIVKIAQKGRAAGIFLVLATQRPSVDIITGLIKANFPGRIACKTASRTDSEVVLDRPGAETLLGRGDAVLQNMKYDSVRFQVAYTTPVESIRNYTYLKGLYRETGS